MTIVQGLGLAALVRHRNRLSPEVLAELIRAVLAALQDSDNLPTNKETLLSQLIGFVDRADGAIRAEVFAAVESMARGAVDNAVLPAGSAVSAWGGQPASQVLGPPRTAAPAPA